MTKTQRRASLQMEQILELELQEMRKFLPNRYTRLTEAVQELLLVTDSEEALEQLDDAELDMIATANTLYSLMEELPEYVSAKPV